MSDLSTSATGESVIFTLHARAMRASFLIIVTKLPVT